MWVYQKVVRQVKCPVLLATHAARMIEGQCMQSVVAPVFRVNKS